MVPGDLRSKVLESQAKLSQAAAKILGSSATATR
jgi:hypothetical protein